MREALDSAVVRSIYDKKAAGYDRLHGLLTFHSDQRGRELLVRQAVTEGATVLDAGGGTGSTADEVTSESGEVRSLIGVRKRVCSKVDPENQSLLISGSIVTAVSWPRRHHSSSCWRSGARRGIPRPPR